MVAQLLALLAMGLGTAKAAEYVPGVLHVGTGEPRDDVAAANYVLGGGAIQGSDPADASACKVLCDANFPSPPPTPADALVGFSFSDNDLADNECRCWLMGTTATSDIASTSGTAGAFGETYCYDCRSEEPSGHPYGQARWSTLNIASARISGVR